MNTRFTSNINLMYDSAEGVILREHKLPTQYLGACKRALQIFDLLSSVC